MKKNVKSLILKARESASLAVNVYNSPSTTFRTGAYIVLMNIAWVSLLHAIFEKRGEKYYYRDKSNPRRYMTIDGEYKAWELSTCIDKYFVNKNDSKYQNIQFLLGLRNKIEHRFMPTIDSAVFGECQSCLLNFEDVMVSEFGNEYSLADSLFFALQYSKFKTVEQNKSIKVTQSQKYQDIVSYIEAFRDDLDLDILSDPAFSFRVFLVQKPANRESTSDATMEFVKFDKSNPVEMKKYKHLVTLIKEKAVPSQKIATLVGGADGAKPIILVDTTGKQDSIPVKITKDIDEAQGIVVIEKLSDEILQEINGVVDTALIYKKRFGEVLLTDKALHYVYSGREQVASTEGIRMLCETALNSRCVFFYWLTKLDAEDLKLLLISIINEERDITIRPIIKLIIATSRPDWIAYLYDQVYKYNAFTQPPAWYWTFRNYYKDYTGENGIYCVLEKKPTNTIAEIPIERLISDNEMSNALLSKMCLTYSKDCSIDKNIIKGIDLITHFGVIQKMLPPI